MVKGLLEKAPTPSAAWTVVLGLGGGLQGVDVSVGGGRDVGAGGVGGTPRRAVGRVAWWQGVVGAGESEGGGGLLMRAFRCDEGVLVGAVVDVGGDGGAAIGNGDRDRGNAGGAVGGRVGQRAVGGDRGGGGERQ